ncbi:hypothetical protein KUTeg_015627 [Tegillarca granosa]|uniref:PAP-associated domain-containing protein n=1 Tax=Tegillarca granosa TaxID=220873 RepID=A0ABQ9EW71_TEGGR|nr:hypothetical protein KUTeg_015627 [Tegillarca granosa]
MIKLALQNTRLLQTYSLFDQRVKPLIYAVRYWAKVKGLAGNPKAGNQLSNYALTWMVLYYLMNTKPSLVPTVEYLASLCGNDRTWIDCWDCSFVAAQMIPSSKNIQTTEELLHGFFSYYGSFDFRASCICVRTGLIIPVAKMVLDKTMKVGVVNIQDPFVLNHNITLNVNDKMASKISQELKIAETKSKTWFDVKFAETKSITDIFNDIVPEGLNLDAVNKTVDASGLVLGKYQFLVPMKTQNMTPIKLRELEEEGDIYLGWCKRMVKFIYGLIERVLMFDCEIRTTNLPEEFHKKTRTYDHSKKVKLATTGVKRGPDSTDQVTNAKKSKTEENKVIEDKKPSANSENTEEQKNKNPQCQVDARKEDSEVPMETSGAEGKVPEGPVDPFNAEIDFSKNEIFLDMDVLVFLRIWAERKKNWQ